VFCLDNYLVSEVTSRMESLQAKVRDPSPQRWEKDNNNDDDDDDDDTYN